MLDRLGSVMTVTATGGGVLAGLARRDRRRPRPRGIDDDRRRACRRASSAFERVERRRRSSFDRRVAAKPSRSAADGGVRPGRPSRAGSRSRRREDRAEQDHEHDRERERPEQRGAIAHEALEVGEAQRAQGDRSPQSRRARPVSSRKTSSRRRPADHQVRGLGAGPRSVSSSSAADRGRARRSCTARPRRPRAPRATRRRARWSSPSAGAPVASNRTAALPEPPPDQLVDRPASRILPWSMIATRSHRASASSM